MYLSRLRHKLIESEIGHWPAMILMSVGFTPQDLECKENSAPKSESPAFKYCSRCFSDRVCFWQLHIASIRTHSNYMWSKSQHRGNTQIKALSAYFLNHVFILLFNAFSSKVNNHSVQQMT